MKGYNHVTLVGNLIADPISKYFDDIISVTFTIAVPRNDKKDVIDFIKIKSWGKLANICKDYLCKGKRVLLDGRIQVVNVDTKKNTWETQIVADEVTILSNKNSIETEMFKNDD